MQEEGQLVKKSGTQMNTLKKVLQYIETYRFWMLASIVLAAVTVALTLYIPILVGRAIDFIIDRGNVDFVSITKLLVEIAILAVSTAVLQWIMNTINNKVTYQVVRDVRNQAFIRIQKLPLKYMDAHSYGHNYRYVDLYADYSSGYYAGGSRSDTNIIVCGEIYCKTDL